MTSLLDFVKKLSFVRTAGSEEEKTAAALIQEEIAAAAEGRGLPPSQLLPFPVPSARFSRCEVEAAGKKLPCVPYLRSGCIDRTLKLRWMDSIMEEDFAGVGDLSDSAVLVNSIPDEDAYKRLVKHKAAAFLIPKGKYYHTAEEASLYPVPLRDHLARNGAIPGFLITAADATALIQNKVCEIRLVLEQENVDLTSQNVEAVIEGTCQKDECIILTAHYDSVPLGTGSWDNATGAVSLLALYRHFAAHPPRRTVRFLWCGSEEVGLLGSRAYIEQNKELLESIQFCFNFDMCGTALGPNEIFVTGEDALETYIRQYCRQAGYAAKIGCFVHSSDSAPFCDNGIPALGLSRGTSSAEIHTIHDLMPPLDETAFQKNMDFAIRIIGDFANAALVPVKKGMSDARKKDLDKYFHREARKDGSKDGGAEQDKKQ